MQNNLKHVEHVTNQNSQAQDPRTIQEKFRARFACYCRNRRLLQRLMDNQLSPMIDYAVRVHLLNCHRCRQVHAELKDLSNVKQNAHSATEFLQNVTPLRPEKPRLPKDHRELLDDQKTLIQEAHEVLERLKRK